MNAIYGLYNSAIAAADPPGVPICPTTTKQPKYNKPSKPLPL